LRAGAIAIKAHQVAPIGNINFNIMPASLKGVSEQVNQWPLASKKLNKIQGQAFYGNITMDFVTPHGVAYLLDDITATSRISHSHYLPCSSTVCQLF
jgi:hypothetical protein